MTSTFYMTAAACATSFIRRPPGQKAGVRHRSLPVGRKLRGSRRSPGGRPEPIGPPAFALRGPDENFRLAPGLRRDRFTRAAGDGLRAACEVCVVFDPHALRRLNPVRPRPATGGGCQVPPGSTVCHPMDSPASAPVRASTDPGSTPDQGPRPRAAIQFPARSRPVTRPGPGPRTPSPCDGTAGSVRRVRQGAHIKALIRAGR